MMFRKKQGTRRLNLSYKNRSLNKYLLRGHFAIYRVSWDWNATYCEYGTGKHGDCGIETDQNAGADEGGSPLEEPTP